MPLTLRVVPPVHSPLDPAAIASGLAAALWRDGVAEAEVRRALEERLHARELVLTGSGTAALTLALGATAQSGTGPVALPAYCCYDIATAADGADVPALLYDVDPATLGPDLQSLERALAAGARRVVVAHLYGLPIDTDAVCALAARYDALLIDDAAQGAGATVHGRPLGTLGSVGVLSFGRGKGITAGRGGALLATDARGVAALAAVRGALGPAHTAPSEPAAALAQWLLARPALYALPASLPFLGLGETIYHPPSPPRAMSRFAAGVLRRTLALADKEAGHRRATAERLCAVLASEPRHDLIVPEPPADALPGALRQPVLVREAALQARFRSPAARRLGVLPAYPSSLADLPGFRSRVQNAADPMPGARALATQLFTLPTHSRLEAGDLRALEQWLRNVLTRPAD